MKRLGFMAAGALGAVALLLAVAAIADPVNSVRITDTGLPLSGGTLTGNLTAPTITATTSLVGTLGTAAQPNVTNVGTLTGLTLGGPLDLGMFAIKDPGNIYRLQATTDAAPINRSFVGQAAFERCSSAGNCTGASRTIAGGCGNRGIASCTATDKGADTYAITVTTVDGTVQAAVTGTAKTDFQYGATGPETCSNVGAWINGNAALHTTYGITATCNGGDHTVTTANCSDSKLYYQMDPTKTICLSHAITDVGTAGTFAATVSGTNGIVSTTGNLTVGGASVTLGTLAKITTDLIGYVRFWDAAGNPGSGITFGNASTGAALFNLAGPILGVLNATGGAYEPVRVSQVQLGTGPTINYGAGAPSVVAPIGSLYLRTDGGANTTLYVKESGTDGTGWVAK